jgi:hypothetical protein
MRRWVKVTLGLGAVLVICVLALVGTGAYLFFRHLDTRTVGEADARKEFDVVRARFVGRPPLVEIANLKAADVRVNRLVHPEGRQGNTLHILTWERDGRLLRADVPVWLMRFSSLNIASRLGLAPSKFSLTIDDLKRYGPGIVVDFRPPAGDQVLIWLE